MSLAGTPALLTCWSSSLLLLLSDRSDPGALEYEPWLCVEVSEDIDMDLLGLMIGGSDAKELVVLVLKSIVHRGVRRDAETYSKMIQQQLQIILQSTYTYMYFLCAVNLHVG